MAEINAKDLTTKTSPASTDSMLLFGTTTNEGAKITVDNLAENILNRLSTKTFPNQVGGSSADTILAQLATLNSNIGSMSDYEIFYGQTATSQDPSTLTLPEVRNNSTSFLVHQYGSAASIYAVDQTRVINIASSNITSTGTITTDGTASGQTLTFSRTGANRLLLIYRKP